MTQPAGKQDCKASIALAFAIGVTGHRDLVHADRNGVFAAVTSALSDVKRRFDHMPIRLITGLAEGADTLAAEAALALGMDVCAVLPMPAEIYEADFSGAALTKFRALCADPRVTVSALGLCAGRMPDQMDRPAYRDDQYALLLNYITRRSNALLALWDGDETRKTGGTADVVLSYLGQEDSVAPTKVPGDERMQKDCGDLAIWVPVRRVSNAKVTLPDATSLLISNSTGDCYWAQPTLPDQIADRWRGLDGFAADRYSAMGADLPAWGLSGAKGEISPDEQALDAEFIRADQLAGANQAQSDRMFKLFGLMAAGMGLVFLLYAKILAAKVFLILYIVLFALGFIAFRLSAKHHYLGRHLAYRAFAETLRVQFFLILSGASQGYDLRRILRLTSVDRFKRFEWLQDAARCAEPLDGFGPADRSAIEAVRKHWIEDQARYFDKKLRRMHGQHETLETVKSVLLAGSILGAFALLFFKEQLHHMEMAGADAKIWLVFMMGLLPLWVAVWELYQGKMAVRELLWQYSNQHRFFAKASMELRMAPTDEAAHRILRDLADRALMEIYLWSVHRYHREHEPPAAG